MIKQLPNLVTLLNLISGCLSILFLFSGDILLASWMIGLAAVFDFLDGMAARWLNAVSGVGKVLDSLADVISFGLAPGFILLQLIRLDGEYPGFLAYIALMVPALSAVRLAIFSADDRQQYHFIGVPTPLNALMIASIPLILYQFPEGHCIHDFFSNSWFLVALAVISSLLLVAPVRIMALKFKSYQWKDNKKVYLMAVSLVLLLGFLKYLAIPVFYFLYILVSLTGRRDQGA